MKKKTLVKFIHINFLSGFVYAFFQFLNTSKVDIISRRLWAYECWIIFGFYAIFLFLLLREKTKDDRIITISWLKGKLRFSQASRKSS